MAIQAGTRSAVPREYNDLSAGREWSTRIRYVLGVSAVLGVVTFTLVYLTTFSFATGF